MTKDNLDKKDRAREGVKCVVVDEGEERGGEEGHRRLKARHHREDLAKLGLHHHLQFECALLLDTFVILFIPHICHFFTQSNFLENKIYTEKRQFFALNL